MDNFNEIKYHLYVFTYWGNNLQ